MEWMCAPQIQMLNPYPTVCLYLGMRIQRQWLKSNEFIRVGPWSYIISVLIRRDTRESSLSPSPSLHFSLSSSFSLSLSLHVRAHQEVSCLKARKRPPRRNQPCHPFCLQDWQKTNVSCLLKLPSLGLCNGSPRWQRQYVSTSSKQISRQSYGSQEKIQEEIEVCLISCPFKFNHC